MAPLEEIARRTFPRVYWSVRPEALDLANAVHRRWWVRQVLLRGADADVAELPDEVIAEAVEGGGLPAPLAALWRAHLARRAGRPV